MEISNSITGYQISLERIKNSLLESLRAGQILQARAMTSSQSQQVQLRIGNLDILAHTQASITAGDNLTLQVIKASDPLQFRVLQEISARDIRAQAMRAALPQQASVSHLMKRLSTLTPIAPGNQPEPPTQLLKQTSQPLPLAIGQGAVEAKQTAATQTTGTLQSSMQTGTTENKLQTVITSLLQAQDGTKLLQAIQRILSFQIIPDEHPSAERIRQAFQNSGLFLEPALASGAGPPGDMKRSILELLLQLRPLLAAAQAVQQPVSPQTVERGFDPVGLLAELVSHAEGSLARILFNQLSSLPGDDAGQQLWQFEIPYRQSEKNGSFRVQIEKETKQNKQGKAEIVWSVNLDFELETTGPIHARLVLIGEEISSRFTAESGETARRLEQALPQLESALFRAGLKVGTLSATVGSVDNEPRPRFPLLDEKA